MWSELRENERTYVLSWCTHKEKMSRPENVTQISNSMYLPTSTIYTARAIQVNKPWTVPLKNSVRSIDHRCHNLIKQSRLMGQKERFCCIDREKMNCSYNLGTHTINTFWTQLIGGSIMYFDIVTSWVHYCVCSSFI